MMKVQAGMPLNMEAVTKRMLEAERHEDIAELLNVPEPAPDPEIEFRKQEIQIQIVEAQVAAQEAEANIAYKEAQTEVLLLESEGKGTERLHAQFIAEKKQTKEEFDSMTNRLKEMTNANKARDTGKSTSGAKS